MLVFFILQTICSAQFAIHGNKGAGNAVVAFLCKPHCTLSTAHRR